MGLSARWIVRISKIQFAIRVFWTFLVQMNAFPFFRALGFLVLGICAVSGVSCMTAYDSHGRPIQAVDPGVAIAGAAAAGVVGYSLANDHNDHHHYRRGYDSHRGYYYGGYRGTYRHY